MAKGGQGLREVGKVSQYFASIWLNSVLIQQIWLLHHVYYILPLLQFHCFEWSCLDNMNVLYMIMMIVQCVSGGDRTTSNIMHII